MILRLKNIKKNYDKKEIIKDISFDVNENEIICIIGPSGSGKSTLLDIIASLSPLTSGKLEIDNNTKISYMFQEDALLDNLNIYDNACLPLKINKIKDNKYYDEVIDRLKKFNLDDYIYKKPSELSGGMKQRVALIRSLSIKPKLILLDEPFSALDYKIKISIINDLLYTLKKEKISAIIVTHNINEAILLGDKIIVLSDKPTIVKNIYKTSYKNIDINKRKNEEIFNKTYNKIWENLNE